MAAKHLLTIFGATGNQGGSVIDVILSDPKLRQKYSLRGVSRSVSSRSAQALVQNGVEMVSATTNDIDSLRAAVRGSYGVFGVTNFWDKDVMSKTIEIQQGKNIFEACKAENVKHYVFSALPRVEELTNGVLKHVEHFDGKAVVAEYVEANKGQMLASYFMPAMYMKSYKDQIQLIEGEPALVMPFEVSDMDGVTWPVIDARADGGKYVVGLFEGGSNANGVKVNAVSAWMSPRELLTKISQESGRHVLIKAVSPETMQASLPENIAREITETMLLVGGYNYYGKGQEKMQEQNDEWLVKGTNTMSLDQVVRNGGPWKFE